jgi:hypothetical protein
MLNFYYEFVKLLGKKFLSRPPILQQCEIVSSTWYMKRKNYTCIDIQDHIQFLVIDIFTSCEIIRERNETCNEWTLTMKHDDAVNIVHIYWLQLLGINSNKSPFEKIKRVRVSEREKKNTEKHEYEHYAAINSFNHIYALNKCCIWEMTRVVGRLARAWVKIKFLMFPHI